MLVRPQSVGKTTNCKNSNKSSDEHPHHTKNIESIKKKVILTTVSAIIAPVSYILLYTIFINSSIYSKWCLMVSSVYTTLKGNGLKYTCHIGGTWLNSLQCEVFSGFNMILMNIVTDIGKYIFKIGQTRDTAGSLIILTLIYKFTQRLASIKKLLYAIHNMNTLVYNHIYETIDIIYDAVLLWNGY